MCACENHLLMHSYTIQRKHRYINDVPLVGCKRIELRTFNAGLMPNDKYLLILYLLRRGGKCVVGDQQYYIM